MTALLPPSTNHHYRGARAAAWFLALYGVGWIVPGMIHSFLPDSGAGTIAGLDLGHNPALIIGLIVHGMVTLAVALHYRTLVPLFLLVSLLERSLLSWSAWVGRAQPGVHHPPEHYASLILIPVILLFLLLALRPAAIQPGGPR
jgi:hypothetical protein